MNLVDQNVVNTWFVSDPTKSRITSHEQAKSAIAHHTHEQRLPSPSNNDNQYIKSEPSAAFGLPAAVEENGCKQEADSGNQLLDSYKIAADLIRRADGILIVAGAGIGVDSGLPDYRGPSGFWRAYPGLENLGLSLEDMSHPDWFEQDPAAAWGFYGHRAELYLHAIPHAGFAILRQITRLKQGNYFVFTSNIDGQFSKASFEETKLFEAHGTLAYLQCLNESCPQVWRTTSLPALRNAAFVEIHQRQHQHQHQHQNSSGGNDSNNDINQKEDGNEKVIPNPPPSSAPPPDIKPFLTIPIALVDSIPKCPGCASMARPNVRFVYHHPHPR
jgi:NAD-dependent SIR2 family protein deacetylase